MLSSNLEIHHHEEEGYQPLVFSHDWQVALLNWEPAALPSTICELERHTATDEVFFLWRGRGALIYQDKDRIVLREAHPGQILNVLQGTWHTVIGDRDSSWIIVEKRDTHLTDTEYRKLTPEETEHLNRLKTEYGQWEAR